MDQEEGRARDILQGPKCSAGEGLLNTIGTMATLANLLSRYDKWRPSAPAKVTCNRIVNCAICSIFNIGFVPRLSGVLLR